MSSRVLQNADTQITCVYGGDHIGVDVVKQYGQTCPIIAHTDGQVVGVRSDCPGYEPGGSYGNYILLKHSNGIRTRYAHLSAVYVSYGAFVKRGQVIGYMGATGFVTGAHLHFEVIKDGQTINPTPYLNADLPYQTTGLVQHADGSWWYYKNGSIDYSCDSIIQNQYGWWKVTKGQVDFSYNGLARNEHGWWMLQGGKVDFTFNGLVTNKHGTFVVYHGQVNFNFSGYYKFSGSEWKIKNGRVE